MAQKSLPILNKVGVSMSWYTTFFLKYYKWLSSQNMFLILFFNKLLIYLDFVFFKLLWVNFYQSQLYLEKKKKVKIFLKKHRFSRPLTAYLLNVRGIFFLINICYFTCLEDLQNLGKFSSNILNLENNLTKGIDNSFIKTFNTSVNFIPHVFKKIKLKKYKTKKRKKFKFFSKKFFKRKKMKF